MKTRHNPMEQILELLEQGFQKSAQRQRRRLAIREWMINLRIFLIHKTSKNETYRDRKIVSLLSREIFVKGGTSEYFQNNFYEFLDSCKYNKDKEEFGHLIKIFKNIKG